MGQNWMRHFELQLYGKDGKGISLSEFKVTFSIEWNESSSERVATVRVYNLSTETNNKIMGKEFSKIRVIAGYDGIAPAVTENDVGKVRYITDSQVGNTDGQNFGDIFNGDIRFTITGKDNITDSWISIQAVDGHQATLYAQPSATLAAGWTVPHLHLLTMRSFNAFGVTQGITGAMPNTVFPRGRAIFVPARKLMDNIAEQCKGSWQIVDGQVQMVPDDNYIQEAILLNSDTGLVGMPQQTMGGGVNVKCLINPAIRINGLIKLAEGAVYRAALSKEQTGSSKDRILETNVNGNMVVSDITPQPRSVATDGVYKVKYIEYTGDTRGQAWYMDLLCIARGASEKPIPSNQKKG